MKTRALVATPLLLLALACTGEGSSEKLVRRAGQPDVVMVSDEDALMNAAKDQAQKTFATFLGEMAAPHPNTHYSVKLMFQDGDAVEHIWVNQLTYEGGVLTGVVDNEPVNVKNVRLGQNVVVFVDRVSDWLILRDGKYLGGYTIRVLRDRMTPVEREQLDSQMGATPE